MDPHRWRLDGQLALVTGGTAGIGRAVARELLGLGASVLLVARDAAAVDSTCEDLRDELAALDQPDADVQGFAAEHLASIARRLGMQSVLPQATPANGAAGSAPAPTATDDQATRSRKSRRVVPSGACCAGEGLTVSAMSDARC